MSVIWYSLADRVVDYINRTDGGGIRGLSELLIIKWVMHRLMVEENTKRKKDGQPLLSNLPKPCDYFDLIGGTSTGGCAAFVSAALYHSYVTTLTESLL